MSIMIKGMKMPERCAKCFLKSICDKRLYMERRPENCPIIEIPDKHGRLIDADALKTDCDLVHSMMMFGGQKVYTQTAIDNAPTIIDADYPPSVPLKQVWTELFGEDGE